MRNLQSEKDNVPIRIRVVVSATTMGEERMGQHEVTDLEIDGEGGAQVWEDVPSGLCFGLGVSTPVAGVTPGKDGKLARVTLGLARKRKPGEERKVVWKPKP